MWATHDCEHCLQNMIISQIGDGKGQFCLVRLAHVAGVRVSLCVSLALSVRTVSLVIDILCVGCTQFHRVFTPLRSYW